MTNLLQLSPQTSPPPSLNNSLGQPPSPQCFIQCGDGSLVPVYAMAKLPPEVQIPALPRITSKYQEPTLPKQTMRKYQAPDADAMSRGYRSSLASSSSGLQSQMPPFPPLRRQETTVPHFRARKESQNQPLSVADAIASTYPEAAKANSYCNRRSLPPSGREPRPEKKVYCDYWIRTGECSFTQQGCLYKHEIPDMETLKEIGFLDVPKWWKEKNAIKLGSTTAQPSSRTLTGTAKRLNAARLHGNVGDNLDPAADNHFARLQNAMPRLENSRSSSPKQRPGKSLESPNTSLSSSSRSSCSGSESDSMPTTAPMSVAKGQFSLKEDQLLTPVHDSSKPTTALKLSHSSKQHQISTSPAMTTSTTLPRYIQYFRSEKGSPVEPTPTVPKPKAQRPSPRQPPASISLPADADLVELFGKIPLDDAWTRMQQAKHSGELMRQQEQSKADNAQETKTPKHSTANWQELSRHYANGLKASKSASELPEDIHQMERSNFNTSEELQVSKYAFNIATTPAPKPEPPEPSLVAQEGIDRHINEAQANVARHQQVRESITSNTAVGNNSKTLLNSRRAPYSRAMPTSLTGRQKKALREKTAAAKTAKVQASRSLKMKQKSLPVNTAAAAVVDVPGAE